MPRRLRQQAERAAAGTRWAETGYVFTTRTGGPVGPDLVTRLFRGLVADSGLPPVTLHGLRHGAATLALAAGTDLKVVQDQLGLPAGRRAAGTAEPEGPDGAAGHPGLHDRRPDRAGSRTRRSTNPAVIRSTRWSPPSRAGARNHAAWPLPWPGGPQCSPMAGHRHPGPSRTCSSPCMMPVPGTSRCRPAPSAEGRSGDSSAAVRTGTARPARGAMSRAPHAGRTGPSPPGTGQAGRGARSARTTTGVTRSPSSMASSPPWIPAQSGKQSPVPSAGLLPGPHTSRNWHGHWRRTRRC